LIDKSWEKERTPEQGRGILVKKLFINLSNFVRVIGISPQKKINTAVSGSLFITLIVTAIFPLLQVTESRARGNPVLIRQIRAMESGTTGLKNPSGLTFSGIGNAFLVADAHLSTSTDLDVVELTPFSERAGSTRIAAAIQNPINMVFDNRSNRLLILHGQVNQLLVVPGDSDGSIHPGNIGRYEIKSLGLQNPQGMTIDEASGTLFILDAKTPRIVKVDRVSDGNINGAEISEIELQSLGLSAVRGLALDPVSGHLFLIDPTEHTLYELTQKGKIVSTRDLKPFRLTNPQAMVFAPSGDQTDDPSEVNLYVADSGLLDEQNSTFAALSTKNSHENGQIVEFSLAASIAPAAANFASSLIRTTDMSAISPPSPDPSGIAYLPASNTLLIVDGEVEETQGGITHFAGANVWELTLPGSKVGTANISRVAPTVTPMTNEPTGIALNPASGHYYVTDDNARRVYDLNPGPDGSIGTADDTWTYFSTLDVGSGDPEGVAFNTWNNHIFVVDGVNEEVYEFTTSGTLISQFDVRQYGVRDPEGIEFSSDTGTLFTLSSSRSNPIIIETTTSGELLQTINISATNHLAAAGLAYAPASDGSGETRFYIVDRGIDNNDDPTIIDGKVYEITAPASGSTPTPSPTFTATPTFTPSASPTSTLTASPSPTSTLTASPTPTSTLTASLTPTSTMTASPTPLPSSTPPETPTFADVPSSHPYFEYIEALYAAGLTAGCSTTPLSYCPSTYMDRAQMAVFTLRGEFGVGYEPPSVLAHRFSDNWALGSWAEKWAEGMYNASFTAGCTTSPLQYCPWQHILREQAAVFALRLKYGNSYSPPPATGIVFADMTNTGHYATRWAEQAYADGLIPSCGMSGGKPLFCPAGPVDRGLGAYIVAKAKNLVP
jgi:uncharacterized protein YjiK